LATSYELSWDEIVEILDNGGEIKRAGKCPCSSPGGEPTMSPYFFDAIRYARKVGYNSVQRRPPTASIRQEQGIPRRKAFEAGLRYAYLQFLTASATTPTATARSAACLT